MTVALLTSSAALLVGTISDSACNTLLYGTLHISVTRVLARASCVGILLTRNQSGTIMHEENVATAWSFHSVAELCGLSRLPRHVLQCASGHAWLPLLREPLSRSHQVCPAASLLRQQHCSAVSEGPRAMCATHRQDKGRFEPIKTPSLMSVMSLTSCSVSSHSSP